MGVAPSHVPHTHKLKAAGLNASAGAGGSDMDTGARRHVQGPVSTSPYASQLGMNPQGLNLLEHMTPMAHLDPDAALSSR